MAAFAGTPWRRLQEAYARDLVNLFRRFQSHALSRSTLRQLAKSRKFQAAAWEVAKRMVAGLSTANARSWREAAMKGTRSREIHRALAAELRETGADKAIQRIALENAKLIRSIPLKVAEQITKFAASEQQAGKRTADLEAEIRRRVPHLTASKIKLIAGTEIGKAQTALTRTRAEQIDLHWGVWQTSEDSRVRPSHRNLNGVLIAFDDPPQPEHLIGMHSTLGPGLPGTFPRCRCELLPLVTLDEVKWPSRVFTRGKIQWMTREAFRKVAGYPKAA